MRYHAIVGLIVVFALTQDAPPASGQAFALMPESTRTPDPVAGDWCVVDVRVAGAHTRLEGNFVKANARWIVLHRTSERRQLVTERATLPLLKTTRAETSHRIEFLWIPRQAATIASRTTAAKPFSVPTVVEDAPSLGVPCQAMLPQGDQCIEHPGKLIELTDEKLVGDWERRAYEKRAVPYLADLPVAGRLFRKITLHIEIVRDERPRNELMCLRFDTADVSLAAKPADKK